MAQQQSEVGKVRGPGMEEVIQAGDTLVITDSEGKEFAVTAREHEDVVAFLVAFDEWYVANQNIATVSPTIREGLFQDMSRKWMKMPGHVARQLPSIRRSGIVIPGKPS